MFILASYSENFGNTVAEAMAMSCPVIVTPEVGLAKLVTQSACGIVTRADPEPLAAAVKELQDDEMKRRRYGRAGHLAALRVLSWDAVAAQVDDLYRSCMKTGAPS